jgi:hypothetical protein
VSVGESCLIAKSGFRFCLESDLYCCRGFELVSNSLEVINSMPVLSILKTDFVVSK